MIKIPHYKFSEQSGEISIYDFFINVDHYLSEYNNITQEERQIKNNFYALALNLQKVISFVAVNHKWCPVNNSQNTIISNDLIAHIRQTIENIINKGFFDLQYANIIFMFHQHAPFTYVIERTYRLLINTLILQQNKQYDINFILSLILSHANTYNNYYAIKILVNKYNVPPTTPICPSCLAKNQTTTMPITQIFNQELYTIQQKYFITLPQEQEHNFILMLNKINFNNTSIKPWQLQQIFRCTFENNLKNALNYLLTQKQFWSQLILDETDIIKIAYSIIMQLNHSCLINIIFSHPNIINNNAFNSIKIKEKINHYIDILNKTLFSNSSNKNNIILSSISSFIKNFLMQNYASNDIYTNLIEQLKKKNEELENVNSIYNLEIMHLEEKLKQLTLDTENLQNNAVLLSEKYNFLLAQFHTIYSAPIKKSSFEIHCENYCESTNNTKKRYSW